MLGMMRQEIGGVLLLAPVQFFCSRLGPPLDALADLACMTEYAETRPTMPTSPATPPPAAVVVAARSQNAVQAAVTVPVLCAS
ncbi:hypothetical protein CCHR01_01044 [Colletotrichum chrysophilum]|uniref:Uncharacterized protein n=1 Tax=Colletotrichum chrysophilum TaxID=1836956 RepID=A0AAD9AXH0_9PEZI|nr:hypothetical protein CCHR01_01044 [Colletotrichum chrysophilum]